MTRLRDGIILSNFLQIERLFPRQIFQATLSPFANGCKLFSPVVQMLRKKKTRHSLNPPQEAHIGWVMDSREHRPHSASIRSGHWSSASSDLKTATTLTPGSLLVLPDSSSNASPSEGAPPSGGYGCTPQSLPKFWHPSHEMLRDNGFTQQGYHKYRRRCLNGAGSLITPQSCTCACSS